MGTAIFLTEYTKESGLTKIIRFGVESLAGIPSIIYGLFGFIFFVIKLKMGWSLLSGVLTMTIMILPTIIRTSEEAIKSVPRNLRIVSYSLGATRWETVTKVVLPSAAPGILTGIMLSIGRAVGETAAVIFTMGSSLRLPTSLMDSGRTMAVHFYILAREGHLHGKGLCHCPRARLQHSGHQYYRLLHNEQSDCEVFVSPFDVKIRIDKLKVAFGKNEVLKGITADVFKNRITGFMGPAASGKSTLISIINRMIDFEDDVAIEGKVFIDGENILDDDVDEVALRRRVGTVFAVPIPLPRSIYENIAFGPRLKGISDKSRLNRVVEEGSGKAVLWDEVKNRLQYFRRQTIRRPAAEALPCPHPGAEAGDHSPRRALLRPRPHLNRQNRGGPGRAQEGLHHHPRLQQHQADRPRHRLRRLFLYGRRS